MTKSTIIAAGAAAAALATGLAGSASAADTSKLPAAQPPDICVSAQVGESKPSWCSKRVKVKVRRKPSAKTRMQGRPRVSPGSVTPPTITVSREPGRITVSYTEPTIEPPTASLPAVDPESIDVGEYEVDPGLRP
ncbi:MAG TPA: hypothetical protein VM266_01960 [Solirubrobacteraceae bacterium]|nr:hypothetical protein [Solirubrobacteraceae bacterium]